MSGNRNPLTASGSGGTGQQREQDDSEAETNPVAQDSQKPPDDRNFDPRADTGRRRRGEQFEEDVESGSLQSSTDITDTREPEQGGGGAAQPQQDDGEGLGDGDAQTGQDSAQERTSAPEQSPRRGEPTAGFEDSNEGGGQDQDGGGFLGKIRSAGNDVLDRADEVSEKLQDRPGGKEAAALVGATAPVAAAEPTPLGEAAVGATAAGILAGAAIAEKTNVDEKISDRLKDFPQFSQDQSQSQEQRQPEGEVPVGPFVPESEIDISDPVQGNELAPSRSRQEIAEVEPGRPQQSEIEISDPNQGSEVGPGIATAPVATGIGEVRERQREEILTGEDIVNDEATSEVDDKLQQIRDQLERRQNQFERDFAEGAGESGVRRRTRNEQAQGELTRVEQPQGLETGTSTGTATPGQGAGFGQGVASPELPGEGFATGTGDGSRGRLSERPRILPDTGEIVETEQDEEDILQKLSETGIGGAEDFERFEQDVLKTDDALGDVDSGADNESDVLDKFEGL